jgi:spermidine synthase
MARKSSASRRREPARPAEPIAADPSTPRAAAEPARRARPRPASRSEHASRAVAAVGIAFFASGAAGLIHEVVWTRLLGHLFGVSSFAIATVLAAYMGGLALGSWWIGARTERIADLRRAYAWLEIGVGVCALAVPVVLALVEPLYGALWRRFHLSFGVFSVLRLLVAGAILLPPTVMMGATFPVLATDSARRPGQRIAPHWLYAVNLAGAVAGVALAGFVLMPRMGVWRTIVVGAAVNFAVAAGILALPRTRKSELEARETAEPGAGGEHAASVEAAMPGAVLLAAAFASGAVALAVQVAWTRVLSQIVGSTTYAFTSVLCATLVALGAGSALAARLGRRRETAERSLSPAFLLAGALALLAIVIVHRLPYWYIDLYAIWAPDASTGIVARGLVTAFVATFPSLACTGMVLPLVLAAGVPAEARATGPAVGRIYAVNTLGSIVGALLAGFVLVPGIGTQRTIAGGALVCVAMGVAVAWLWARPVWIRPAAVATAWVAALAVAFTPRWDPQLLHGSVSEVGLFEGGPEELRMRLDLRADELYAREGRTANVLVIEADGIRGMKIDGRTNASDMAPDMSMQSMLALYPLVVAPRRDDVFIVGWGTGVTVGAALQVPVRKITAVELEPAVVEASKLFAHVNHSPLDDPRVELYEDDARHILLASDETYDVIISEPPHPWVSGVANLFTRDFYELAARHLRPDGVFAQWVQSYQISFETYRWILATFQSVFPEMIVFTAPNTPDTILVGSRQPLRLDVEELSRRFADERFAAEAARVGVTSPEVLLAGAVIGPDDVREIVRGAPINTDDNMLVEFHASVGTTHEVDMGLDEIRQRGTPVEQLTSDGGSFLADRDRLAAYVDGLRLLERDPSTYERLLAERGGRVAAPE